MIGKLVTKSFMRVQLQRTLRSSNSFHFQASTRRTSHSLFAQDLRRWIWSTSRQKQLKYLYMPVLRMFTLSKPSSSKERNRTVSRCTSARVSSRTTARSTTTGTVCHSRKTSNTSWWSTVPFPTSHWRATSAWQSNSRTQQRNVSCTSSSLENSQSR